MKDPRPKVALIAAVVLLAAPVAWACPEAGSSMTCMPDRAPAASSAGCHEAQSTPEECCVVDEGSEQPPAVAVSETESAGHSTMPLVAEGSALELADGAPARVEAYPPGAQASPRFVLFSTYRL